LKRFISNDSRRQAVFEINSVITEAIAVLSNITNSKYMNTNTTTNSEEYTKSCENLSLLLNELDGARQGIENLKFTYQNDQNTASQLDIVILKVNTAIKDFSYKLSQYQSYLYQPIEQQTTANYSYLSQSAPSTSQVLEDQTQGDEFV
jgi:hypothetical protein